MELFLYLLTATIVAITLYWAVASVDEEDIWSIGIYCSNRQLEFSPHSRTGGQPVLTAADVTDADAVFVADPFLIRAENGWLMFFEVLNAKTNRGEIAYASSPDGIAWKYERLILRESFHLSYPQVFCVDGVYYMIPETREAGSVRLYKASSFPNCWTLVAELLNGSFLDPTICQWNGLWYLFALRDNNRLALFFTDSLAGPWIEHPDSPVTTDRRLIRPAGRILQHEGRLLRFSQDGSQTYGQRVFASEIITLNKNAYREHPHFAPVIEAAGGHWNADGMHHVDLQQIGQEWIAAVDGKYIRTTFKPRKGARALLNRFGLSKRREIPGIA